jgi:hypothetical protein
MLPPVRFPFPGAFRLAVDGTLLGLLAVVLLDRDPSADRAAALLVHLQLPTALTGNCVGFHGCNIQRGRGKVKGKANYVFSGRELVQGKKRA